MPPGSGRRAAYLVPPMKTEPAALAYFAEACGLLAEFAARRMVRLCVEPVPGRAIARDRMLDWLDQFGDDGPSLLLDVGHCLISGEEAAAVVRRAEARLGYVHLDDNDGSGDLHWPLLTGRLTEAHLADLAAALRSVDYRGVLSLELNGQSADPRAPWQRARRWWNAAVRGSSEY